MNINELIRMQTSEIDCRTKNTTSEKKFNFYEHDNVEAASITLRVILVTRNL